MKYLFVAILVILVSCKSKEVKEKINVNSTKVQAELQNQEIQPGQIMAPCGFYIGMNENQIVEYAKNNKKKFFTDKRYKMASLKTKIDDKVYSINFSLYNDKLDKIFYIMDTGFVKITDVRFKEHYTNVYNLIKELNNYKVVKNTYFEKFNTEFPDSFENNPIEMASFQMTDNDNSECFKISIDQNPQNNTYFIAIEYIGAEINNFDKSLIRDLYFDGF
jgi:hypothetical protein